MKKNLKTYIKEKKYLVKENFLYDIASIDKEKTSLPMVVWIKTKDSLDKQSPRLYVSESFFPENLVSISISSYPKILSKCTKSQHQILNNLRNWIIRNKENLLKVWNGEISHIQFGKLMK